MPADQENPRVALRIKAEALAADLGKYLTVKPHEEVRDVPEPRSGDHDSSKGESVRDLIAWLGVLVTLGWLWKNRRTKRDP